MVRRITPTGAKPLIGEGTQLREGATTTTSPDAEVASDEAATSDALTKEERAALLGRGGTTAARPDGIGRDSELAVEPSTLPSSTPGSDGDRPGRGDLLAGAGADDGNNDTDQPVAGDLLAGAAAIDSGVRDRGLGVREMEPEPPTSTLPPGVRDPFGIGDTSAPQSVLTSSIVDGPSAAGNDQGGISQAVWDPESGEVVQRVSSPATSPAGTFLNHLTRGAFDPGYKELKEKAGIDIDKLPSDERHHFISTLTPAPAPAPAPEPAPAPAPEPAPAPAPESKQPGTGDPGPDGGGLVLPPGLAEDFARFDLVGRAVGDQLARERASSSTPDSTPDPTGGFTGAAPDGNAVPDLVGDDRRGVETGVGGGGGGVPSMGGQIGAINPGPNGTGIRFHGLDQEVSAERVDDDVSHLAPSALGAGDAVNLAARLCATADAGEVVVCPTTLQLAAPIVQHSTLGVRRIKGKVEPVELVRIDAIDDRPPHRTKGVMVGRTRELARLAAMMTDLVELGRGGGGPGDG